MTFDHFNLTDLQQVVIKRPGMFIGREWDSEGMAFLLAELVRSMVNPDAPNAPTTVDIRLNSGGEVSICDNGRGLPVEPVDLGDGEIKPRIEQQLSGYMERRLDKAYYQAFGFADNLITVANYVSESFTVYTVNQGTVYKVATEAGQIVERLHPTDGVQITAGTRIDFKPDPTVFGETEVDLNRLVASINEMSEVHTGVKFSLQVSFVPVA